MDPGEQIVARGRHPGERRLDELATSAAVPFSACAVLFSSAGSIGPDRRDRAFRDLIPAVRRALHNERYLVHPIA